MSSKVNLVLVMAYVLFSAMSALFCAFLLLVTSPPTSHSNVQTDMEKLDAVGKALQDGSLSDPELESGLKCSLCEMGMRVVQDLFVKNKSQDEIASVITKLCITFRVEDKTVCTYIVKEFKHEILTVIDKLALSPSEACGLIVSDCGSPYDPTSFWNITLPNTPKPPVTPPKPPKPGAPVSRVLFLSDVHVDLLYKPGANTDCGEPLCCRANSPAGKAGPTPAGKWGDYRYCDTPLWTLENLLQHLAQEQSQFDYAVWTGDVPPHDVWNQSRSDQLHVLDTVSAMMLKYLHIPIYPALGNHESAPVDSFPPPFITGKDSISWLYDALAQTWTHWTPIGTKTNIERGAFYSVLVRPGLRLISINTNYCNTRNWWLLLNTTDPAGQLQWLAGQLQQAEDMGEKVHIIGHIPPGTGDCMKAWSWNYYKIIDRYESTVAAQFFGHTHRDHFELFYDMKNRTRPTNIAYIGPSVTPYQYLNPGYKVYEIDGNYTGSSMQVVNQQTYIMNLTDANLTDKPNWTLEYDTKEAYNMQSQTPADWDRFVQRLEKDDKLFQLYYRYYYKSNPTESCDQKCRAALICDLKTGRSNDPSMCPLTSEVTWHDLQNYRTANRLC
ncbi:PREDICTED: sphingomyelin phosphodiesterase-like [Branchiostoma belcheri]|uniref:Sphingomyelin phosphodiesterase n=1 Tax=Branchiostoma belcheri TaxID=7741 RepID=A0A6P4Y431_BRABE|nr:PREDICTED: sphingomyelin phosphodiesterase-like [Branchiostoma belcheri]